MRRHHDMSGQPARPVQRSEHDYVYRSRMVREPREVLAEFGTRIADDVEIRVHDSTADLRYLVLPIRPPGSGGLGEAELAALVTRDCMIGTALPEAPRS